MHKHFTCFVFFILLFLSRLVAQDSTIISHVTFSGYVDAYYSAYSDSVGLNNYEKYTTISPRSNQFGLDVAMLTAKYSTTNIRSVLTVHFGDIPRSSWSATYNYIQEANAGIRLSKNLWLDAGFFRTHFGTEALLPKENYTSSVSVPTYYEPYYESGFRLDYEPNEKLSCYIYALNGYGIYEDNNTKKSGGLLITYIFNKKVNIGYSGYYGDDTPEGINTSHFRAFHNLFLNYKGNKLKITAGGDFGTQQNSQLADSQKTAILTSGVLIVSYNLNKKYRIYTRGEVFSDPDEILSGVPVGNIAYAKGLQLLGTTVGIEYKPADNSYLRLEGRNLMTNNGQTIFYSDNKYSNSRFEIMLNLGVWFE